MVADAVRLVENGQSRARRLQSERYRLVEMFQRKKQLRPRRNLCKHSVSIGLRGLYNPTYREIETVRKVDIVCGIDPSINFRVQSSRDG